MFSQPRGGVMRALAACAAPAATSRRGAVRRARPRYARRGASRCSTARVRASGPDAPSPGPPATVHLVGAGPGGLDTLTVKALRLLRECDAVVYDDLGGGEADILAEIPTTAERVFVGKRGGDERSWRQDDINATLVRLSVEDGKTTVRLKGGCPSVFGRTSQEMRALRAAGVSFELVPGVSSALAGPLAASIPLTEKLVGKHFAVASAHDCDALDFETAFRGIDTCVFLMAGKSVPTLCERLVNESGKKRNTPVVIVRWACTDREEIIAGTLGDVSLATAGRELSPCVFVAGEVCAEAVAERLGNANFVS